MIKKILILPFVIFSLVLLTFFYLLIIDRNPSEIPSTLLNKNYPKFETESLLKKEKFISVKEFENKTVLVNFFASWCKSCSTEHKFIQRFSDDETIKVMIENPKLIERPIVVKNRQAIIGRPPKKVLSLLS